MNARLSSVRGTLPDGRAGLVLKQHPGWTAIYSAAPKLPTPLLRRIAELGKVHCFTAPGDVIWATHDLPAVGVNGSRPSHHHPPTPGNGDGGTHLGDNLRAFQADFEERATRVFVLK